MGLLLKVPIQYTTCGHGVAEVGPPLFTQCVYAARQCVTVLLTFS